MRAWLAVLLRRYTKVNWRIWTCAPVLRTERTGIQKKKLIAIINAQLSFYKRKRHNIWQINFRRASDMSFCIRCRIIAWLFIALMICWHYQKWISIFVWLKDYLYFQKIAPQIGDYLTTKLLEINTKIRDQFFFLIESIFK